MSGQATCSLSEALTALAFDDPTPVALVPNALKTQRWGCSSDDVLTRLYAAVHTLCDAGYRGDLKIWGRPIRQSGGVAPRLGAPKILNQAECLNNRLFVPNHDALWPGSSSGDEYADAFAAESSIGGFDEVCVDRADLGRLLATASQSTGKAERECEVWLRQQFAADPEKLQSKKSFARDAIKHFGGRLSERGFSRVWAKVAPGEGRDKAGRPKKSNQSTK